MRSTSILTAYLFAAHPALGQSPPTLSSADLLDDVDVLRRVYEGVHPGLYRYNTKADMDGHFAALRAEFARDRSLADAYVAVSQYLAKVRCGHTHANFANQPAAVTQALFRGRNRVPFCFRWIAGRMVVTRDLSAEKAFPPGTHVLAVNGVEATALLAKLMTVGRADGANDAKRVASLEVRGTGRYEAFDVFLPLFYPATGDRLTFSVRLPGAERASAVTVAAHDHDQRKALGNGATSANDEAAPRWTFARLADGSAYLRMPTWALYDSKWDWRTFLDRGMDELIAQNVPALIVDLRGNEGGQDVGNVLIERIAAHPVRNAAYRRYTRYRTMPAAFTPYLSTWDKSFREWGRFATEDRDGYFRMTKYDDDDAQGDVIAPRGKRYVGRVVVLTDASNSSATFQFAQVVKEHKLVTLVGQPTGGNRRGINGSAFFFLTLPHSKIEADLPLVALFAGDDRPTGLRIPFQGIADAGIEPDVTVTLSVDDIARGVDPELRAAQAVLKGSSPP